MSFQQASTKTRKRSSALDTRLHGRWLVLSRGVWLALVILTLGIFFASLPVYIAQLQTPCAGTACGYGVLLTHGQVEVLKEMGLSPGDYAAYIIAFTLATMVLCLVISTLIVWRRSDDRMALLVALMLVTLGTVDVTSSLLLIPFLWQMPNACLYFLTLALLVLVFSLFPTGQFVPSFTRWAAVVCLAGQIPSTFFPNAPFTLNTNALLNGYLLFLGEAAILVVAQLYRYRRVSSSVHRFPFLQRALVLRHPFSYTVVAALGSHTTSAG